MPSKTLAPELLSHVWDLFGPLLPPTRPNPKGGRPRASDRACFFGIVYKRWFRKCWRDLPPGFPSGVTCWRRLREWRRAGVWNQVWGQVVDFLDEALGTNRGEYEHAHDGRPADLDPVEAVMDRLLENIPIDQADGMAEHEQRLNTNRWPTSRKASVEPTMANTDEPVALGGD